MIKSIKLSNKRIVWIREQGYHTCSVQQIQELAFGNRFAYRLHLLLVVPAVILANIPLLIFINMVVLTNIFLPNHPFDYIYNYLIRRWMSGPKLPPRPPQFRFSSIVASTVLAFTTYFIAADMMTAAYIMGSQLIFGAGLVALSDFCFLARIYNSIRSHIKPSSSPDISLASQN